MVQPASVAAFFSEDGSLRVNDEPPPVGRAAITGVMHSFMAAFPDLQVAMDDFLVRGDEAKYHWTLTGTNTGLQGTGKNTHQRPGKMASGARWTDCVIAGKLRRGQHYARLAHGWYFGEAHLSLNVFRGHRCLRVDRMARDEESAEEFRSYETIESVSAQSSGR